MRATPLFPALAGFLVLAACGGKAPQGEASQVRPGGRDDTVAVNPARPSVDQTGTPGNGPAAVAGRQVFVATGRIERLDAGNGHVVITHDEIPGVNLKAGSTEFVAEKRDPLALLKPGQSIDFSFTPLAEGGYMITEISPAPPTT